MYLRLFVLLVGWGLINVREADPVVSFHIGNADVWRRLQARAAAGDTLLFDVSESFLSALFNLPETALPPLAPSDYVTTDVSGDAVVAPRKKALKPVLKATAARAAAVLERRRPTALPADFDTGLRAALTAVFGAPDAPRATGIDDAAELVDLMAKWRPQEVTDVVPPMFPTRYVDLLADATREHGHGLALWSDACTVIREAIRDATTATAAPAAASAAVAAPAAAPVAAPAAAPGHVAMEVDIAVAADEFKEEKKEEEKEEEALGPDDGGSSDHDSNSDSDASEEPEPEVQALFVAPL